MSYAKKSLGQNFLMHAQTAERIADAAMLPDNAHVLEIGPGTGMLTKALLARAGKVVAVEADDELAPALKGTFGDEIAAEKLEILHGDIRSFDPISLGSTYHIVANIPYYITGEIIRQFLTADHKPSSMTLLVQKEVAERIARNGGKESLLSLSVKAYGDPKYCFTVPRGAFNPAPSVDSAVLSIQHIRPDAFASRAQESWFFSILRAGFAHKRKKLAKNIEVCASPEHIGAVFEQLGLRHDIRSEALPLDAWQALAQHLFALQNS